MGCIRYNALTATRADIFLSLAIHVIFPSGISAVRSQFRWQDHPEYWFMSSCQVALPVDETPAPTDALELRYIASSSKWHVSATAASHYM